MTDSPIAAAARDIKERFPALCAPKRAEPTDATREAVARLEAARIRAQGGKRPEAAQLSLDMTLRGKE